MPQRIYVVVSDAAFQILSELRNPGQIDPFVDYAIRERASRLECADLPALIKGVEPADEDGSFSVKP